MRWAWIGLASLLSCVRPQTADPIVPGDATLGIVRRAPNGWLGWLDDGTRAVEAFALREADQIFLLEPQDSPEVLGLRPGSLEVTDQACIEAELQQPLPPLKEARGFELVDARLLPLDEGLVEQRLSQVFLRSGIQVCEVGCVEIRDEVLRCSDPCPALIEPEAPAPPNPPTPPNPCPSGMACAPFAAEPPCPAGNARMLGSSECRPVGAECGPDLRQWPTVGPLALYVDADSDGAGIPNGQGRPNLQAALDELSTGVIAVRGRFDPNDLVVVGQNRDITIVGHCPAAVVLPRLQILGQAELRDVSIGRGSATSLHVEGSARLSGVHVMGPAGGIQGGADSELVLRDVLLEDVQFGIASEGMVDAERIVVRGREVGITVSQAQLTLRRARLEGAPTFTAGALHALATTTTVAHVAIDGSRGEAVSLYGGHAVVEDLWTHRTEQAAMGVRGAGVQLRRLAFTDAGTRGIVGYRTRTFILEDFSLEQGPSTPNDSDAITMAADDGEAIRAYTLRRIRIRGDRFGNVVSLWPAADGFSAAEACPQGRSCNLVEDLDIEGSVNNERDSVAVQAGLSDTVYRRIRLREWRDSGFSIGPSAYADVEDWSHESSVRTDFGFRLNHPGLVVLLRRVALRGVVIGFEIAAGNIGIAELSVADAVTALRRGISLQDTNLEVERFDLRTQSGALAVQELANIGAYELRQGQVFSQDGVPILGAECSNPYLGMDQVRILTP
jgi:hypothetical protein